MAALLSAGALVLGLALALLTVFAPALIGGSGLSATAGPRPDRVAVQVVVGLLGELAHRWRSRLPAAARPAVSGAVILAVFVALWWGWWR